MTHGSSDEHPGAGALQDRWRAVGALARRLWRLHLEGYDRIPQSGPAILCPNHISFLDSAFLMLTVPRRISFVGKAEYMDSWKTKHLFPALGMIPIDRSGGDRSQGALEAAEAVLRRGELFGIFPEGTRSRDGELYRGHTGAARSGAHRRLPDPARSASSAPARSSRPTPSSPRSGWTAPSASGGPSTSTATRTAPEIGSPCARSPMS